MGKRRGRREVRGASWDPVYALERAIVVDVSNREGTVYATVVDCLLRVVLG